MSEFSAALGLLQLNNVGKALEERKAVDSLYREKLSAIKGIKCLPSLCEKTYNYAYFPVMVQSEYPLTRDELYLRLQSRGVNCRRYFFPLISDLPMYRHFASAAPANLPVAKKTADQVLCLPIYPGLKRDIQAGIIEIIDEA
jgi:dTDP-4-amino-4,6-dideoxygalactose transaminase